MAMPTDVGIIDTMIGFPHEDMKETLRVHHPADQGLGSRRTSSSSRSSTCSRTSPTGAPRRRGPDRRHARARWTGGASSAASSASGATARRARAASSTPTASSPSTSVDPNDGMDGIRQHRAATTRRTDIRAVGMLPGRHLPAGRASTTRRCTRSTPSACELGIPVFCCAGVPGPRLKMAPQQVELHRRGDVRLPRARLRDPARVRAVEGPRREAHAQVAGPPLLARARSRPKHYPKAIIDYANTRGADKIIYAGYFPMGLSLERIMTEMPNVAVQGRRVAEVPRENAERVLKLK